MNLNPLIHLKKNGYYDCPRLIQFEITDACPLQCSQCYKPDIIEAHYMSEELFKRYINEAVEFRVAAISYNGGEPLMHPLLSQFIEYASQFHFRQVIYTSGAGIDESIARVFKNKNIEIGISLNGSTEEINQKSRDGYKNAVMMMDILNQYKIHYHIHWVARHDNVHDLQQMIVLGEKHNADYIQIVCNKINGNGIVDSPLDKDDYDCIKTIICKYRDYIRIQNCYGPLLYYMGNKKSVLTGCQAGISSMAVTTNGEFMPCTHLLYVERARSMCDYWEHSRILKKLRKNHLLKHCNQCQGCRVCRAICKESHDDLECGYEKCPVKFLER